LPNLFSEIALDRVLLPNRIAPYDPVFEEFTNLVPVLDLYGVGGCLRIDAGVWP
jgi:hypothetical protein